MRAPNIAGIPKVASNAKFLSISNGRSICRLRILMTKIIPMAAPDKPTHGACCVSDILPAMRPAAALIAARCSALAMIGHGSTYTVCLIIRSRTTNVPTVARAPHKVAMTLFITPPYKVRYARKTRYLHGPFNSR
jgi:hypothetical protein